MQVQCSFYVKQSIACAASTQPLHAIPLGLGSRRRTDRVLVVLLY